MSALFHPYLCGRIAAEWLIDMETERFISGYCRQLDQSRMVTAELTDGKLAEADCCYGNCVYQSNCTIAKELDTLAQA